jgi:hypothetical protein
MEVRFAAMGMAMLASLLIANGHAQDRQEHPLVTAIVDVVKINSLAEASRNSVSIRAFRAKNSSSIALLVCVPRETQLPSGTRAVFDLTLQNNDSTNFSTTIPSVIKTGAYESINFASNEQYISQVRLMMRYESEDGISSGTARKLYDISFENLSKELIAQTPVVSAREDSERFNQIYNAFRCGD